MLVTNCSNNYGPYQFPEKLIPLMILNAVEGKPLPVYGDGQNVRDWLFVEDHCRALWRVLTAGRPGETYNIGGDCEQTNLDVVQTICRTGRRTAARPASRALLVADYVRHGSAGPRPPLRHRRRQDPPRAGLAAPSTTSPRACAGPSQWYLDNSQWIARVASGEYQRQRLGLLNK